MAIKVTRLSEQEERRFGFTHKAVINASDFPSADAAATTTTIELIPAGAVPAGTVVTRAAFRLATAFDASDAAINSVLLEVGDGNDTDRFIPSKELAADGTSISAFVTANATATLPFCYTATDGIDAKFTVAGGASPTVGEVNSGKVEIFLHLYDLNKLA